MGKLWQRISGRVKMTKKNFCNDIQFSLRYALLRLGSDLGGRLGMRRFAQKTSNKKNLWVERYLTKTLGPVLEQYRQDTDLGTYVANAPIWVCWWTGEESAPELVKRCIESIRKNANGHPVHLITKDNYGQFLNIPSHMIEKVDNGSVCVANFTDYMRFMLLGQYGGLWLDATIYCAQSLPEEIFQMPVFTCKGRCGKGDFFTDYRWTSFCFGGYKGNVVLRFVQAALEAYWKNHEITLDYFLLDYIVHLGCKKVGIIGEIMEELPENNLHRDDLQAAMNAALPAGEFENVLQADTVLYKLSWREKYSETTAAGEPSIYDYFLNMKNK